MTKSNERRDDGRSSDWRSVSRAGAVVLAVLVCLASATVPVAGASSNAEYSLNYLRGPGSADAGSTITVKVDVVNTGSGTGSGTVDYRVDTDGDGTLEADETLASKDVFFSSGQSETLTFSVTLDGVPTGTFEHGMVTDSDEETDTIQITEGNGAPSADAGADETVGTGEQVTLDASDSTDPDGDSLSYSWTQTGGQSVSLSDADTATPSFVSPDVSSSSTLSFEVTVDDGTDQDTDSVSVTVDPDDSGGSDDSAVRRSLSAPKVRAGGTVNVTLTVEFEEARDRVSIKDEYDGPIESVSYQYVHVNGERSSENVLFPSVDKSGALVALQDLGPNATVEVVYSVEVKSDASTGDTITFTGSDKPDVVAGDFAADFEDSTATVGVPSNVERELESTEATPGGSLSVTLSAELSNAYPSMSIQDGFEGPVSSAKVDEIRLDGQIIPEDNVVITLATNSSITAAVEQLPADSTIEVDYTVAVSESASEGDTISFEGIDGPDVSAPSLEGEFGNDVATVVEASGPVERYDENDDGTISTEELNAAIKAWATGQLSTENLNLVIQAWVTSA